MRQRRKRRIDAMIVISEYFYVAGGICCVLYFSYERDEIEVMEYIQGVLKELNQNVEKTAGVNASPLNDQLTEYETISPHPDTDGDRGLGLTPSMSMESLRAAGEGVNVMIRKVMRSAFDKVDELKRNSFMQTEAKGEEAPLLRKVTV